MIFEAFVVPLVCKPFLIPNTKMIGTPIIAGSAGTSAACCEGSLPMMSETSPVLGMHQQKAIARPRRRLECISHVSLHLLNGPQYEPIAFIIDVSKMSSGRELGSDDPKASWGGRMDPSLPLRLAVHVLALAPPQTLSPAISASSAHISQSKAHLIPGRCACPAGFCSSQVGLENTRLAGSSHGRGKPRTCGPHLRARVNGERGGWCWSSAVGGHTARMLKTRPSSPASSAGACASPMPSCA